MEVPVDPYAPTPLGDDAQRIYNSRLRETLERDHLGAAVAIHVDSGDFAVGPTHRDAALALLKRHQPDGRIVTLTIGPPTDSDLALISRMIPGKYP